MEKTYLLEENIKKAFQELHNDLEQLIHMAYGQEGLNEREVRQIEHNMKQNLKAIEYFMIFYKHCKKKQNE
ncbi:hypothetical protein [Bacillus alveayuensis]|jgi:hypothetical protein|uniref:Spo0E like sporulation regulatory protein n=1 Tax=Aeribacillus alveayuensis TaxID=279215 RepID=A0ABT9VPL9_9BACI|nr:hypothetical protein [Bacillus alveayuensis]MDQ0162797.1 hypothetical protein [Bacillus alveayuensis]